MTKFNPMLVIAVTGSLLVSACSDPEVVEQGEKKAPAVVKLAQVAEVPREKELTFPAVVSAVKTVDVSFEVTGRLVIENLTTGREVNKGELLAKLDPVPFQRKVKEQETRKLQASRELKRLTAMHSKGLIPQSQLDAAKTEFEIAEIELSNAKQDLGYATITAPFDAQVSERFVDNNSYVAAGTSIARLQDVSKIYFTMHVPERVMTGSSKNEEDFHAEAVLLAAPDRWFDVDYVEHSTQPDPVTQTYQAVFSMQPIDGFQLTPGARARVKVSSPADHPTEGVIVPMNAVVNEGEKGFKVWKYQAQSGTVVAVNVQVVKVMDKLALVTGDLAVSDKVVAAGANKMTANMAVKPFTEVN